MNRNHAKTGQHQANQQQHSRTSREPTNSSSKSASRVIANKRPPPEIAGGAGSINIKNAPTSLANLAQLSGITLLPIGEFNQAPDRETITSTKRTTTAATNRNLPQDVTTIQLSPSTHRISATATRHNNGPTNQYTNTSSGSSTKPAPPRTKPTPTEQPARIFNISSISSVQSLNNTSNDLIFRRNPNLVDTPRNQFNNHTQSMSSANNLSREMGEQTRRAPPIEQHSLSRTNGVQVIPVSSNLSSIQYLSRAHQSANNPMDPMDPMASLSDSVVQENDYVNVNGDANNISLIKLMAILNNPALTITAVGPKEQSNKHIDGGPQSNSIFETFGKHQASNRSRPKPTENHLPPWSSNYPSTNRASSSNRLKLPQSAANLQIIHGSQLHESTGMAQLVSVNSSDARSGQPYEQRADDTQMLDWLSDCSQVSRASNDMQMQYSGDSHEMTKHDSADPTVLSTSVRNLMMQQISQSNNNKQQNKSAQLLRHIANQEQDNDDSRSRDQNQLSTVDSVYIPSHHRIVKQVSDDVKVLETEQVVSTSGLLKKKPNGPARTSRYRLYVPGMDNGNLRHSRTNESRYYLSDIQIVNKRPREVHLSDRHSMIDSMMNLPDKKKRKNESTEPDDIFINRSKRVMSKIDTMLERKKRRRFERISGRESPKNNSIEDQCAESEEEWSCDDGPIDLDSVNIIKTQLPLEEVETQAKKDHFMSVGLVSRTTKHNIEAELCKRKMDLITPIVFEELEQSSGDIQRFIDTILRTNGEDVQLRIDSSIKRNDLPFLEGLNRNTSRLKMSYMNSLGLEKRSKRTTLYKVKQIENTSTIVQGKQQPDLITTSAVTIAPKDLVSNELRPRIDTQRQLISNTGHQSRIAPQTALKLVPSNCRDILKLPNKNDYMKSLGLMAS